MSDAADPGPSETSLALSERLRREIDDAGGAIPFSRFMDVALYAPGLGYYERGPANVGRSGDFYTSVSVGPLFGELLAVHIAPELLRISASGPVRIVEAGAHDGRLASDILGALDRHWPELAGSLRYAIVEPSDTRRAWQAETLAPFTGRVEWLGELPTGIRGVILSNELLDAFPLRRWRWRTALRRWMEQGVAWGGSRFQWADLPGDAPVEWALPDALADVLPDGFAREDCPAADAWWRHAARSLEAGLLLACDYGHALDGLPDPSRPDGTLRGYRRHRHVADPLGDPGDADLTAHVDFSRLRETGTAEGLSTEFDGTQSGFLTAILRNTLNDPERFGVWTPARLRAFQTLTHPQHLGRAFRSLVQARGR